MQSYSTCLSLAQIKKLSEADFLAADAARCLLAEQREQANEPVLDTAADEIEIEITAPAPATCINPALLALMRAYRAKQVTAVEKIKVERYLKKNRLSPADLPDRILERAGQSRAGPRAGRPYWREKRQRACRKASRAPNRRGLSARLPFAATRSTEAYQRGCAVTAAARKERAYARGWACQDHSSGDDHP